MMCSWPTRSSKTEVIYFFFFFVVADLLALAARVTVVVTA